EREVMRDMRVGVMYYHRTNRNQIGTRNMAVPTSAYTPVTVNVPNGPNGPTTATVYNLSTAYFGSQFQNNVVDNDPFLNTDYNGVEVTANKRFSKNWQMVAGLTVGKNRGGINTGGASNGNTSSGQQSTISSGGGDLNDPNNTLYPNGVIGNDSVV